MSDEKNVFDFHGLSDDEELDKLLESVRRDIGEASPEPERSARTQPRREAPAAREPVQAAAPSAAGRRAAEPRAQQLRQQRPTAQRAGGARSEDEPRRSRAETHPERELPPQRERIRVVHPEDEKPERKKSRFGLAFGIYTAVLALVLIAACVVLWFYVGAYEATRPESVMAEFAQLANEEYWADAVEGAFNVGETPFEDRDELMDELCMSVIRDNDLVWREDDGYSADNMVYMVSAGGTDICRVTLGEVAENGDAGFGFTYLEVTRVELLASFTSPETHEITITVPKDAVVSVNGVQLTDEYIDADAEIVSAPEAVSSDDTTATEPSESEDGGEEEAVSPSDNAVTVAGLSELEAGRAGELYTVYRVGGLYAPAEVYAADAEGNALAAGGKVTDNAAVFALGEGTLDYRILVPEGSTVTVNGVELDDSYNTGETAVPALLEGFENYGTLPELQVWEVDGLHIAPEVTVTTSDGDTLDDFAADGTEIVFFTGGDQTLQDAHSGEVSTFANAYVEYLTGESGTAEDYTALQALVLDGSALDTALSELNGDYEANGLTAGRVRVRGSSFVSIGATCYVCTVDVQYTDADDVESSTAYTIVFVMNGGVWLAANVVS